MRSLELFIARRYLRSKRKEVFISIITVISVLGVAVSVLVLNIVLAVMTGFEEELQAKLLDTSAHVTVRPVGGSLTDWESVRDKIQAVPGVVTVSPYTYNQALISTASVAHGLLIRGIADDSAQRSKLLHSLESPAQYEKLFQDQTIEVTRPDDTVDQVVLPPLLIGRTLQRRYALLPGEPVTLLSPQLAAAPQGLIPKLRRFLVVGSYSSGLVEYESGLAYTSLSAAQKFFGLGNSVSGLEIMVRDLDSAVPIAGLIRKELGGSLAPYEVNDWTVPNKPLWDALRLEKRVYFIVLLLLILVASFSIVSTLVMVVMEKTKDIAVLKSLGMSDRRVMRIFLLQGSIIGVVGTLLGTVLGWLGCIALREYGFPLDETVFSLRSVPVRLVGMNFLVVAGAAFLITTIAGLYPARRAARLRPADALRFE